MAKNNDKINHALHIKRNTAGTSNEISFSVLDAAKNALDNGGSSISDAASGFGAIKLFSMEPRKRNAASGGTSVAAAAMNAGLGFPKIEGGSSVRDMTALGRSGSSAWQLPIAEISRRKASRRRHKVIAVLSIIAVVVALIFLVFTTVSSFIHNNRVLRDSLYTAIDQVGNTDETVLGLDELVTQRSEAGIRGNESTENQSSQYAALSSELDSVIKQLDSAAASIGYLQPELTDSYDVNAASQSLSAIEARKNLIHAGTLYVERSLAAEAAVVNASSGWQAINTADTLSREAAELASNPSRENSQASIDKNKEALSYLDQATRSFRIAQENYPDIDFQPYLNYLGRKTEALNFAIASDQAYLDRDKEAASRNNDKYAESDAIASELAAQLSDPVPQVENAAQTEMNAYIDSYSANRLMAGESDAFLREYLGDTHK